MIWLCLTCFIVIVAYLLHWLPQFVAKRIVLNCVPILHHYTFLCHPNGWWLVVQSIDKDKGSRQNLRTFRWATVGFIKRQTLTRTKIVKIIYRYELLWFQRFCNLASYSFYLKYTVRSLKITRQYSKVDVFWFQNLIARQLKPRKLWNSQYTSAESKYVIATKKFWKAWKSSWNTGEDLKSTENSNILN